MSKRRVDVETVELTKRFGEVVAVDNLSIHVEGGEIVTLLGPSGCGKTTTLRMIAGFIKPDKGTISVDGEIINDKAPYERDISMFFQNYALFPHMTVYDNIAFGLKMRKVERKEIKPRVEETLQLVRLQGYGDRYPAQLSGGEQQRVALARAVVTEPSVLLLDEPLSNLDLKLRINMRSELREIQRKLGITTIYVTHDQTEGLTISDRIAVMNRGRLTSIGSPVEIYCFPKERFVADFIGENNLLDAHISKLTEREIYLVTDGGIGLKVARHSGMDRFREKEKVILCIRPDNIVLATVLGRYKATADVENVVAGKIERRQFMGSSTRYWLRLKNDALIYVDAPVKGKDFVIHEPGETVEVFIDPEIIHIMHSR